MAKLTHGKRTANARLARPIRSELAHSHWRAAFLRPPRLEPRHDWPSTAAMRAQAFENPIALAKSADAPAGGDGHLLIGPAASGKCMRIPDSNGHGKRSSARLSLSGRQSETSRSQLSRLSAGAATAATVFSSVEEASHEEGRSEFGPTPDPKYIHFEQAPILGSLILLLVHQFEVMIFVKQQAMETKRAEVIEAHSRGEHASTAELELMRTGTLPWRATLGLTARFGITACFLAGRTIFFIAMLLLLKIVVPLAIHTEASAGMSGEETDMLRRIVGAAFLAIASLGTEEDPLRDIYWIVTIRRVLALENEGGVRTKAMCSVKFTKKDLTAYIISLTYNLLTSFCFVMATWSLMRRSTDLLSRCMNTAALTAILFCDEAIHEHIRFDIPGAEPLFVTVHHVCSDEADAVQIARTADSWVALSHWIFSTVIISLACAYMVIEDNFIL